MIDTVVIPAAGLGGRLIPVTKEIPKIMLPIFQKNPDNTYLIKPLLEILFENLYDVGIRNYCIIVGRGKETIENHLTPHYEFLDFLKKNGNNQYIKILNNLYRKIEKSSIIWKRQHKQLGIGHTVLLAKDVVGDKPFLFHLGDLYLPSKSFYKKLFDAYEKYSPQGIIGLKKIDNPKQYGIAYGNKISKNVYAVSKVIEKPKISTSNLGLSGINIFDHDIYNAAKKTKQSKKGEIELTDCVQTMMKMNYKILGFKHNSKEICIDMGTPTNYFKALKYSYNTLSKKY
ncbi:MAG: hypothetical protein K5790_09520 [Nitrosopumilus sp.]|uniref:sugar phosphate nucleotidyltransferase n=1 Tax=Nitrosopumilus sp. TaxID=2024843 RepID=UPI00247DB623|nr:sugar phosphate nucleotidyltransferase [Nitrosopumilus sp.]MCV0393509.1 hypothetical protein [Nitrosopumilus sp.]